MAGLLEGVLPAVYSYGNTMQRKLKGLLADPLGTVGLGVIRAGEDQQQLVNLAKDAGYMPGSRSVLATPQQKALAQALLAKQATDMGAGMMQAATVWHGSPHKFDRFDSSKIGTGEGAQAYGHGLYLADSPATAKSYQASTTKGFGLPDGKVQGVANVIAMRGEDAARKFYSELGDQLEPTIAAAKQAINNNSSLYKVDLPDPLISRMLDWDKPLSQQAPEVQAALKVAGVADADNWMQTGLRGSEAYKRAKMGAPAKLPLRQVDDEIYAAQRLRQAGIPGIRYLDGGSRGAGAGTSNYVVFPGEESALTILERNGSPVNALVQALRGPR